MKYLLLLLCIILYYTNGINIPKPDITTMTMPVNPLMKTDDQKIGKTNDNKLISHKVKKKKKKKQSTSTTSAVKNVIGGMNDIRKGLNKISPLKYKKLIALGDIHGDAKVLDLLLKHAGVLSADGKYNKNFNNNAYVQTGDMVDRGREDEKVAKKQNELFQLHPENVFPILGNHETMVMMGNFKYTKSATSSVKSSMAHCDGELNKIWQKWPGMRIVGNTLFMHGGLNIDFALAIEERTKRKLKKKTVTPQEMLDYYNSKVKAGLEASCMSQRKGHHIRRVSLNKLHDDLTKSIFAGGATECNSGPFWWRGYSRLMTEIKRAHYESKPARQICCDSSIDATVRACNNELDCEFNEKTQRCISTKTKKPSVLASAVTTVTNIMPKWFPFGKKPQESAGDHTGLKGLLVRGANLIAKGGAMIVGSAVGGDKCSKITIRNACEQIPPPFGRTSKQCTYNKVKKTCDVSPKYEKEKYCDNVQRVLDIFKVERMVVGHTIQKIRKHHKKIYRINGACGCRLVFIDTGNSNAYRGDPNYLVLEDGQPVHAYRYESSWKKYFPTTCETSKVTLNK